MLFCMLFGCCGCRKTSDSSVSDDSVFQSNTTAGDYIEGYWTDSKGNYLLAQRTADNIIINYIFSMPTVDEATMYLLDNGTLLATYINDDNIAIKEPVMMLEYVDENTFSAKSLINGETYMLSRDSFEPDETRLDDEYVFKTMGHASKFLNGVWTDNRDNYITLTVKDDGSVSWSTNISFPECDYIDFYDGNLSCVKTSDDDTKDITPALMFEIKDRNHVTVKSLIDDFEAEFLREEELSDDNIKEYAFWNVSHTVLYLKGRWENDDGKYINVEVDENGKVSWKSNILDNNNKYQLGKGYIYTVVADGTEKIVLLFELNSINEVTVIFGDDTYILRKATEEPTA